MTSVNPTDPIAPALPGIDPPAGPRSSLEVAVDRTLQALDRMGLLDERHAALCELCRTAAATVAIGVASRRSSGASLAMKELREALAALPAPPELDGATDEWDQLARDLAAASDGP